MIWSLPKKLWLVAAYAGLAGCGTGEESKSYVMQIIGEDNRVQVAADGRNIPERYHGVLNAIGRMTGNCTAFHIGNGLVLTAGHCIAEQAPSPNARPCQSLAIDWGHRYGTDPYASSRCVEVLEQVVSSRRDFAVLKVDPVPPYYLEVEEGQVAAGTAVTVFGHPNGDYLSWSQLCQLQYEDAEEHSFAHQCDTVGGNSGSPVFDNTTLKVLGIHNGGYGEWNHGTLVSDASIGGLIHHEQEDSTVWDGSEEFDFGPFGNNEDRLLLTFPSKMGSEVSFALSYSVENQYDEITVADKNGRIRSFTGKGDVTLRELMTPVTVAFKSDYANPSERVFLNAISFTDDE